MIIPLTELEENKTAIVKKIDSGRHLIERLNALGIRENKKITKISSSLLGGPITIRIDKMEIAIGRGMASKIMVEV